MENNIKNGNEFTPCTQFLFYFLVTAENISNKREIEMKKIKIRKMKDADPPVWTIFSIYSIYVI